MPGTVEAYLEKFDQWKPCLEYLRTMLLETGMEEKVKWGMPVYCLDNKNVAGIGAFASYVGIWFFQGALLEDPEKVLHNAQEGKTKAMRQWRFQSLEEIRANRHTLKQYLREAKKNQAEGREIRPVRTRSVALPKELKQALASDEALKKAFQAITPGKRREYAEHIASAKRADTRKKRLDKAISLILGGKGLNDKYK